MRNSCLVALFLPSLLFAQTNQSAPPEQKCTLSGHVTGGGTGQPLSKATVQLQGGSAHSYTALSNPDGSFQFLNVEPGSYRLWANHDSFLFTSYGARKGQRGAGSVLNLKAGQQLTDLNIELTPQAVVAGKLVDEDGDPATADGIQLLAQTWMDGKLTYQIRSNAQPDDRGQFRASGLFPGKYVVAAEVRPRQANEIQSGGKPPFGPVTTYYPAATSIQDATPIELRSGQELDGIEIRMRSLQTFHIRGKVAGTLPQGTDRGQLQVVLAPESASYVFFGGGSNISKTGSFDIAGVGPGSYELTIVAPNSGPYGIATAPVTVGSTDVNGVTLNIVPPGTLRGRVSVEGTPPSGSDQWNASNIRLFLTLTNTGNRFGPQPQASAGADGTFAIDDVNAGIFKLRVSGNPATTYLKSVLLNAQDVTGKMLDLSQGGSGELELVFRYGAAEVSGTVQFPESSTPAQSGPSATVILLRDDASSSGSDMKFAESDQNSAFHMKGVSPGVYHAYAFEEMNTGLLQNPVMLKAISDKGVEIEVKENDTKQVQLSVISADDVRQLLARLGIEEE